MSGGEDDALGKAATGPDGGTALLQAGNPREHVFTGAVGGFQEKVRSWRPDWPWVTDAWRGFERDAWRGIEKDARRGIEKDAWRGIEKDAWR